METNCYHGRDKTDKKIFGGMLHAKTMNEAAEKAHAKLGVKVGPNARAYFVDQLGNEVRLYISVHPEHTAKGQAALAAYYAEKAHLEKVAEAAREVCPNCGCDCGGCE